MRDQTNRITTVLTDEAISILRDSAEGPRKIGTLISEIVIEWDQAQKRRDERIDRMLDKLERLEAAGRIPA